MDRWIRGLLTEAGTLKNGGTFHNVYAFEHDSHTNLLFYAVFSIV
jgi:hypothetical protein